MNQTPGKNILGETGSKKAEMRPDKHEHINMFEGGVREVKVNGATMFSVSLGANDVLGRQVFHSTGRKSSIAL